LALTLNFVVYFQNHFINLSIKETVSKMRKMGVRVVMVTGDHIGTATSIALQVGILSNMKHDTYSKLNQNQFKDNPIRQNSIVLNGPEIEKLTNEEWKTICCKYTEIILSRATPNHKLMAVKHFQSNGHSVLMVGDGVNDVQALKRADLSVAMSSGSKLATDRSDVILLNNNFGDVLKLILTGRQVFMSIKKVILLSMISSIFSQYLSTFLTTIIGIPELYSDLQMTLVTAFTDLLLSIMLFLDKTETFDNSSREDLINTRLLIMGLLFLGPLTTSLASLNFFIYIKFYSDVNLNDLIFNFSQNFQSPSTIFIAQSVAFYSIVVMQSFGNMFTIRTRRLLFVESLPIFKPHRNFYLVAACIFVFTVVAVLVSFSISDVTNKIPLIFYFIPLAEAAFILILNEFRKIFLSFSKFYENYFTW